MSDEPRRLLDDPDLSQLLREDLTRAATDAGVGYDASAGLDRLRAAIGAPPTAPDAGSATATATASGGKALLYVAIAVVGIGAIAVVASQKDAPPPPAAPVVVTPPPPAPSVAPKPIPVPSAELSVSDLPTEPPPSAAASAPPAAKPESAEEKLRAEIKQLASVRAAPPLLALRLANEGHQRFQGGVFYQERETLAISALTKLGRSAEAKARGRAFLASFPKGPYAERVQNETGLTGP
jgi:hypothetical protein